VCYYIVFGFFCVALIEFLCPFIYINTDWNPYVVWIAALSATTFFMYEFDKLLSKIGERRIPERILHLLAILGGFPGGWAGMMVFHHKTNIREHPDFWGILALSTLGHAALIYYWFLMMGD
jgi:uncharacterized membrane protein YsdA (DUF1294 family)